MTVAKTPKEAEVLGTAFDESLRTLKEEVWETRRKRQEMPTPKTRDGQRIPIL